jgi:hypothetical protein
MGIDPWNTPPPDLAEDICDVGAEWWDESIPEEPAPAWVVAAWAGASDAEVDRLIDEDYAASNGGRKLSEEWAAREASEAALDLAWSDSAGMLDQMALMAPSPDLAAALCVADGMDLSYRERLKLAELWARVSCWAVNRQARDVAHAVRLGGVEHPERDVRESHQLAVGLNRFQAERIVRAGNAGIEDAGIAQAQDAGELTPDKCDAILTAANRSHDPAVRDQVVAFGIRLAKDFSPYQVRDGVEKTVAHLDPSAFATGRSQENDRRGVRFKRKAYGMGEMLAYGPWETLGQVQATLHEAARKTAGLQDDPAARTFQQIEFDQLCKAWTPPRVTVVEDNKPLAAYTMDGLVVVPVAPDRDKDPAAYAAWVAQCEEAALAEQKRLAPVLAKARTEYLKDFGARPHLLVAIDAVTLAGGAETPAEILGQLGAPIPAGVARELAKDATWQAVVVESGRVVGLGSKIHPPGVVPPPEDWLSETAHSHGYIPSDSVKAQVMARDQRCMVPGCTGSVRPLEYDHVEPFDPSKPADQQTVAANVEILCKAHHQLKTHHGWQFHRDSATGATTITTSDGTTITVPPTGLFQI